jgi:type IV pilus assembly protein PilC
MPKKKKTKHKKLYIGGVPKKTILFFTKNLSIMLKTGSTLNESLIVIKKLNKGKFHDVLDEITSKVEKGIPFSEALSAHPKIFSQIYINIVKIGEESGTLDKNLKYLTTQLEKSHKLKKQMIGAMIYPMIILGGTFILGTVLSIFVLPKLTRMFKNFKVELPLTTRILISFSDFMEQYGLYFFIGMIILFFFLLWFVRLKQIKPFTHRLLLKIPVVKVFSKNYNLSMFYRSLSVLLISGTTIDDALVICSKTVNNATYQNLILHFQRHNGIFKCWSL